MEKDIRKILSTIGEDIQFKNGQRVLKEDERLEAFEASNYTFRPGVVTHRNGKQFDCNLICDIGGPFVWIGIGKPYASLSRNVMASTAAKLGLPLIEGKYIPVDFNVYGRHVMGKLTRPYGNILTINKTNIVDIQYGAPGPSRPSGPIGLPHEWQRRMIGEPDPMGMDEI